MIKTSNSCDERWDKLSQVDSESRVCTTAVLVSHSLEGADS